tara:strand:+ start:1387 stop:1890 length:504 start_codon:yes stop_codon:yes gene_type:complete
MSYTIINKKTFTANNTYLSKVGSTTQVKIIDNVLYSFNEMANNNNYGNFSIVINALSSKGNKFNSIISTLKDLITSELPVVFIEGNSKKNKDSKVELPTQSEFHAMLISALNDKKVVDKSIDLELGKKKIDQLLKAILKHGVDQETIVALTNYANKSTSPVKAVIAA